MLMYSGVGGPLGKGWGTRVKVVANFPSSGHDMAEPVDSSLVGGFSAAVADDWRDVFDDVQSP